MVFSKTLHLKVTVGGEIAPVTYAAADRKIAPRGKIKC
jgi:hypothetical protein